MQWWDFSVSLPFLNPIKQVLKFECLSESALQKYMWTHYSGHLGSSLAPRHFVLGLSPSRLAFANIRDTLFSRPGPPRRPEPRSGEQAPFDPAAANHRAKSISRQKALSPQQLIAPRRLRDVAGCLLSEGKSLFAPPALTSLPAECACLSLITRETVQGGEAVRRRGGAAERTHGDDQMWLMLFTFEGK